MLSKHSLSHKSQNANKSKVNFTVTSQINPDDTDVNWKWTGCHGDTTEKQ